MTSTSKGSGDPAPSTHHARVGTIISGKYRVERLLGQGGMGAVLACQHLQLRRTVAIKLLLPRTIEQPQFMHRLVREARAAAALKSPHVARVFDVGELETGAPYIVMEYLDGETLAAVLRTNGRLTPTLAVDYALQVCEALAEAHRLGIVHRDLKPANLFLARTPGRTSSVRVLDFGIAKAVETSLSDSMLKSTDSHAFLGSPAYVSPEQLVTPRDIDARTDIWSLGVVLHECLAGHLPFDGENLPRLWDSILRAELPPINEQLVPPLLARVIRRCLEKDRDRRYPNVLELARDLAEFAPDRARSSLQVIEELSKLEFEFEFDGSPDSARRLTVEQHSTLSEAASLPPRPQEPRHRLAPFRPWLLLAGILALVLIVLLGQPRPSGELRPSASQRPTADRRVQPPAPREVPEPSLVVAPPPEPPPPAVPTNNAPAHDERRPLRRREQAADLPRKPDTAVVTGLEPPQPPTSTARPTPTPPRPAEADDEAAYSDRE